MGYPDMNCMHVNIWIHHMQIDELFDYLSGRIDMPPPYWFNHEECPYTVTGGYTMITLPYKSFSLLRSERDWEDHFSGGNPIKEADSWSTWDRTVSDNGFDDHADFVDLD